MVKGLSVVKAVSSQGCLWSRVSVVKGGCG